MEAAKIKVVLADDHPIVRSGIRDALLTEQDLALVGEASTGHAVQHLCLELNADVLLLDLNMPGPGPLDTVTHVLKNCPSTKVVILTAFDNDACMPDLLVAGVRGYILKDETPEAIVNAIRVVAAGGTWLSRPVIGNLVSYAGVQSVQQTDLLGKRDRELLQMMARGWDNARIASELNLAEQTVRNYTSRVYNKLGFNSRAEAIIWARNHGMGE